MGGSAAAEIYSTSIRCVASGGRLMLTVLGGLAEFERDLIRAGELCCRAPYRSFAAKGRRRRSATIDAFQGGIPVYLSGALLPDPS